MSVRLRRLIGTRAFYAMLFAVVVPIIVQNAISNFVNLLDNLMVGRIGTEQMSGVAIANQLFFVFNLAIFGAVSGAGIFTAQYHGAGNVEGVRASFRYKLYACLALTAFAVALFLLCGTDLVSYYLHDNSDPQRVARTLNYALDYLGIMLVGLVPFAVAQCYSDTLRETGETALPMYASIAAVLVNLVFNYLLIFGKFGFPLLGVKGAAIATVLSRYVELAVIAVFAHANPRKYPFASTLYRKFSIPRGLVRDITLKGTPLLLNELLWATSMATLNQIYSLRGLDVVAATNISSTVYNLFSVAFLSMGSASAIIVGQALGANDTDTARDYGWKLMAFSVALSAVIGSILFAFSRAIPFLYNTTLEVHDLATWLIRVNAFIMPFNALVNCAYFIIRSGGRTGITFLFDCAFAWVVNIPLAFCLARFTGMSIILIFLCVQLTDLIKCAIGLTLIRKGIWIHNIVAGS